MAVNATPTTPQIITAFDIRMIMRDVPNQVPGTGVENIMFDELPEFSDDDINRALRFTVARFNITTPLSNDNLYTINPWLLLIGVTELLLRGEAMRQQRNQLTYGDGDIAPIGIDDKVASYTAMADGFKREFDERVKAFKVSRNAEACYGSLGSGYRAVSRFVSGGA